MYTIVIPSRYGSTRLPGKPLLDIEGKPMVQRVWEQAKKSSARRVVIATDDHRIQAAAQGFGAEVCMTSASHPSGTDRLQEVATSLKLDAQHIVVNVQGDEPLIPPSVIDQVAENLAAHADAGVSTLCEEISVRDDLQNPNVVKVVRDSHDMALYFSRAFVPWPRDAEASSNAALLSEGLWYRHIGIYGYRTAFLHQYVEWPPAPIEVLESLEQLRALYHGVRVHVGIACEPVPGGIDTEHDLAALRDALARKI